MNNFDKTKLPDHESLKNCNCCPRDCKVNRISQKLGWCKSDDSFQISSICCHRGEEPVLSGTHGICNIFFAHCNLQCLYCQNYQISRRDNYEDFSMTLNEIINMITAILNRGAKGVGFVSPSHFIPQMLKIIDELDARGLKQPYVYNTNGYDKPEIIKSLESKIDVYLPDLKYMDNNLAKEFSRADNYVEYATASLREMYRQKGAQILLDDDGYTQTGLIVRHLVLPGHVQNSKDVLRFIAYELSPDIHISLMSQYYPTVNVANHPVLGRPLYREEYEDVLDEFDRLGFHRGFVQDISSQHTYRPDFDQDHPFERNN